jgi:ribosomal protein S27AE
MDKKSQLPKKIQACPRCGSVNIRLLSKLDVWLTPRRYVCNDCGYVGPVILELEKLKDEDPETD